MRRPSFLSVSLLVGFAAVANAQQPAAAKPAGLAGTWNATTMVGPKDSVVATYTLTATASDSGWKINFPNREPVAARVAARGGDSLVIEAGPYPSYLRPGQTVTLLRTVVHYKGDDMWGTFEAQYASGDKLSGKTTAKRAK
jgi:hypothetical protein